MTKRFSDSEKFNDPWYRRLNIKQKIIYEYLISECNHAGILEKLDLDLISFKIGENITTNDLKSLGDRIVFLNDETLYLPKFIKFQYGILNPQNKVHASVLKALDVWKIQAPTKPLASPLVGAKDKDKDKDKDNIEKLYGEYSNVFLTSKNYGKLLSMCASEKLLNELINSFSSAIEVGKERPYTAELPNAHFERLKSYYNYRKRNPERFKESEESKEDFWGKLAKQYEGRELVV